MSPGAADPPAPHTSGDSLPRLFLDALPRRLSDAVPKVVAEIVEEPSWPGTVERPPARGRLGTAYDTAWSRRPAVRRARELLLDDVALPITRLVTRPEVIGAEVLDPLPGPCLFVANHSSHLDTTVLLASLPERFRHRCVVAAAADTFFDRRWKAAAWSFALASIPIERTRVNRASSDLAAELLDEGWSVIIYPEGGRTRDGWGQKFSGGAAYLAKRAGVPVVPVHLQGVRPILPKGGDRVRPGSVSVRFGPPLRPRQAAGGEQGGREEDARHFAARIEQAVAELADEAETDWWSARRRAARGETPSLQGPQVAPWRRAWSLPESRRAEPTRTGSEESGDADRPWERRGR
jgi:1-acyl-sn-glycerol-3-phosphate acyltransferase